MQFLNDWLATQRKFSEREILPECKNFDDLLDAIDGIDKISDPGLRMQAYRAFAQAHGCDYGRLLHLSALYLDKKKPP